MSEFLALIQEMRKGEERFTAYDLTLAKITEHPNDPFVQEAHAFAIYDRLKTTSTARNFEEFFKYYDEFLAKCAFNDVISLKYGWVLFKGFKRYMETEKPEVPYILRFIEASREIPYEKPSDLHSIYLNQILSVRTYLKDTADYILWWNFDMLRDEDFEIFKKKNKTYSSLAEKALYGYSELLIEQKDIEGIKAFRPFVDRFLSTHPQFRRFSVYVTYFAYLLGERDRATRQFISFIKSKKSEHLCWIGLSEINKSNTKLHLACLCRAMLAKCPPDHEASTRRKLIPVLIEQEHYREAKTELAQLEQYYIALNLSLPEEFAAIKDAEWYEKAQLWKHNRAFYGQTGADADEFLYNDIPEQYGFISGLNEPKQLVYFKVSNEVGGMFKSKRLKTTPQRGDVYYFRVQQVQSPHGPRYEAVTINDAPKREFENQKIRVNPTGQFGFVEDIFIEPALIQAKSIRNNETVKGVAAVSYDKKKDKWGWKAVALDRQEE